MSVLARNPGRQFCEGAALGFREKGLVAESGAAVREAITRTFPRKRAVEGSETSSPDRAGDARSMVRTDTWTRLTSSRTGGNAPYGMKRRGGGNDGIARGLFATMLERADIKEALGLNRSRLRSTRPESRGVRIGYRVLVLLFAAYWSVKLPVRLEAAIQVEGTATYQVFSRGIQRLLVEERFSMVAEGDKWSITTRLVSTKPPLTHPEMFCPQRQSAGSDGKDVYYLKEIEPGTSRAQVACIEPGPVPNMIQSPTVSLLWMAYCSGRYLGKLQRLELSPVWGTDENRNRRGECLVRVSSRRNPESPDYLDELDFLSDGRINPCNPSNDLTNTLPRPWAGGFTQAVFSVEETMALPIAGKVPKAFKFELFSPVPSAAPPRLNVLSAMEGTVAAATGGVELAYCLPLLPRDQQVMVLDYRFSREVTNWSTVSYAITNEWSARDGVAARAAAAIHARINPPISLSKKKFRKNVILVRYVVVATLLLPLAVAAGWWLANKRKQRES